MQVFGFGARKTDGNGGHGPVDHCFPISPPGHDVEGIDAVLSLYRSTLPTLLFSGPTLFTPIIKQATRLARSRGPADKAEKYSVHLLLTDGAYNDRDEAIQAIIEVLTFVLVDHMYCFLNATILFFRLLKRPSL